LPGLLRAAQLIEREFPEAKFFVPTTAATHPVVEVYAKDRTDTGARGGDDAHTFPPQPRQLEYRLDAFDEMVPRCDLCLTVSGTATLHVAGFGVPMIVVYRSSRASWDLLGRWLINTRTFALVNVLAAGPNAAPDRHIVPEFVPWFGDARPVAKLAIDFLRDPAKLSAQRAKLDELVGSLDHPGASMNVARMALDMLNAPAPADLPFGARFRPMPPSP
jgi:lipid A disaccharide synthetase